MSTKILGLTAHRKKYEVGALRGRPRLRNGQCRSQDVIDECITKRTKISAEEERRIADHGSIANAVDFDVPSSDGSLLHQNWFIYAPLTQECTTGVRFRNYARSNGADLANTLKFTVLVQHCLRTINKRTDLTKVNKSNK